MQTEGQSECEAESEASDDSYRLCHAPKDTMLLVKTEKLTSFFIQICKSDLAKVININIQMKLLNCFQISDNFSDFHFLLIFLVILIFGVKLAYSYLSVLFLTAELFNFFTFSQEI